MSTGEIIKRIKKYSIISFILPLIAINSCFFLYKALGDYKAYHNFNWNEDEKVVLNWDTEIFRPEIYKEKESIPTFTNCPKHTPIMNFILDEKILQFTQADFTEEVSSKFDGKNMFHTYTKTIEKQCIKNNLIYYFLLKNIPYLEKILLKSQLTSNTSGFSLIKNPYLYGEVSISRTARYFPATYIFKPFVILASITLLFYWINNLFLFNRLKKIGVLSSFSKTFLYFGSFSCAFLILHALFLGLDIESEIFAKIRRLIIILFIVFEICGQFFLTKSIYNNKQKLEKYINPVVLYIKVTFIGLVFFGTLISAYFLIWGDVPTNVKNILEWNYFSLLLVYYFLSRLIWR